MKKIIIYSLLLIFLLTTFCTPKELKHKTQNNPNHDFITASEKILLTLVKVTCPNTMPPPATWEGSGFIISEDGKIATTNHNISDCKGDISVYLNIESNPYPVTRIIKRDEDADLAIIEIGAKNLPYVKLLNPEIIKVGEDVGLAALFSNPPPFPFPIEPPLFLINKGIISLKTPARFKLEYPSLSLAKDSPVKEALVINTSIDKGYSGGPLFLSKTGEVIGIIISEKTRDGEIGIITGKTIAYERIPTGSGLCISAKYLQEMLQEITVH